MSFLVAVAVMNCPTGIFWEGEKPKEALPCLLVLMGSSAGTARRGATRASYVRIEGGISPK